mmetsp:Transcript_30990/g.73013  ORF Transcript_30990/g.73013 Transcript_30990/m.73013 type:complete len:221 (-) Transcript_30990:414-1076(-)
MIRRQECVQNSVQFSCAARNAIQENKAFDCLLIVRCRLLVLASLVKIRTRDSWCQSVFHNSANDGYKLVENFLVVIFVFIFYAVQVGEKSVLFGRELSHESRTNVRQQRYRHSETLCDIREMLRVDGFEPGRGMDGSRSQYESCRSCVEKSHYFNHLGHRICRKNLLKVGSRRQIRHYHFDQQQTGPNDLVIYPFHNRYWLFLFALRIITSVLLDISQGS